MPKPKKAPAISLLLADKSQPLEHRRDLLRMLLMGSDPESLNALDSILESLASANGESVHAQKTEKLAEIIKDMEEGPLRSARFISMLPANGSESHHGQVILDDGTVAYTVVPDEKLRASLRLGDCVLLERSGRALLKRAPQGLKIGDEAKFERSIDKWHVEVSLRGEERSVYLASQEVVDKIKAEEVKPGDLLIVNQRQSVAFDSLPAMNALSHFQYLVKSPVPNVVVERDIGAPPRAIEELANLVRLEMTRPELRRAYKLRRCNMQLFAGVPGSGKTLAVNALWRRIYEIMSEVTGVPLDDLPPRVFTLQMSQILSPWVGVSDSNLARFFSEVEQMASEPFLCPDGREIHLPVIAVLEEIDGIAAQRGQNPIYDRILTTALQRLDSTRAELKDKLILYIGTTNEAQHVDPAFLRRIGGKVEQFNRLKRRAFVAILEKHLANLPIAHEEDRPQKEKERELVSGLTAWLYSPNGSDEGLVELTFAGSPQPERRFRRDFLTGALIDRAVHQAAVKASDAEHRGASHPGVDRDHLVEAFDDQIRAVADQLSTHNVHKFLNVPDAARVASVRRLPQASLTPMQLQRR